MPWLWPYVWFCHHWRCNCQIVSGWNTASDHEKSRGQNGSVGLNTVAIAQQIAADCGQ